MKINKDRIFTGSAGTLYVNFFLELLHGKKIRKNFNEYSQDIQNKVNRV